MKIAFLILFILSSETLCQQQQSVEVEYTLKNGQLQRTDGKQITIPEDVQQQLLDSLLELSKENPEQEYVVSLAYESTVTQNQTQTPLNNQAQSQTQRQTTTQITSQSNSNQSQQIDQRDIFDFLIQPNGNNGQTEAQVRTIYIPNSRNMTDGEIVALVQQGNYQVIQNDQLNQQPNQQTSQQNKISTITYQYNQTTSSNNSNQNQNATQQMQRDQNQLPNLNRTYQALKLKGDMYYQLPENDQRLQGASLQIQDMDAALQDLQNQPAQDNTAQVQVNKKNYKFQNIKEQDQNDIDSIIQNFLKQQTSFTSFQQQLDQKQQQLQEEEQQEQQEEEQNEEEYEEEDQQQQVQRQQLQEGDVDLTQYQLDYQTVEEEEPEDMITSQSILQNLEIKGGQGNQDLSEFQTISPEQYEQLVVQSEQPIVYEDFDKLPQNIDYRALLQLARSSDLPIPTRPQQFNSNQLYFSFYFKYLIFLK